MTEFSGGWWHVRSWHQPTYRKRETLTYHRTYLRESQAREDVARLERVHREDGRTATSRVTVVHTRQYMG